MPVYVVPNLNRASEAFITKWQSNHFGEISGEVEDVFARNAPDAVVDERIMTDLFEVFFGPRFVRLKNELQKIGSGILWDPAEGCPARLDKIALVKTNYPAEVLRQGQIAIKAPGIERLEEWPEGVPDAVWSNIWQLCESHALPGNKYRGGLWGDIFTFRAQVIEVAERPAPGQKPAPQPATQPGA